MKAAKQAANRLFAWCKIPEGGDAEIYLTGAIGILAEYPLAVMEKVANPMSGSALLPDHPSLQRLRAACDKAYEPLRREEERSASHMKLLPAWDKKLTEEDRARRAQQVADWRKKMAENLPPEPFNFPPSNATAITTTITEEESSHGA